ncbi:DUF3108 domain-containing protein [Roseomonas sp. 18066]|uniref:DUF3108 domain-containing protein n=1 Tax=Roseomonas sp. 18066 TaxID=2681412 RepID=UPI00135C0858|nr:DUF3108 domain-containing protein [Roseomonas sp. 18066]
MRWRPAALLLSLLAVPALARAEPMRAVYSVQAAGVQVMRVEAIFDLDSPSRYRIESSFRFTGLAGWFAGGRQANRVDGVWVDNAARPVRYVGDGLWRGEPRQTVLEYRDNQPVARVMIPAEDPDREPVPEALQRGTVDSLTALAQLTRNLATTGRCEGRAAIFDGRRRADMAARTLGRDRLTPQSGSWGGEAVRCGFEARQLAGFKRDDGPDAREPQEGLAWMAAPLAGGPIIPVRVEMPGRWLGRLTALLVEVKPAQQQAQLR